MKRSRKSTIPSVQRILKHTNDPDNDLPIPLPKRKKYGRIYKLVNSKQYTGLTIALALAIVAPLAAQWIDQRSTDTQSKAYIAPVEDILLGDCDGDGVIDSSDIDAISQEIHDRDGDSAIQASSGSFPGELGCDVNQDGSVGMSDIDTLIELLK